MKRKGSRHLSSAPTHYCIILKSEVGAPTKRRSGRVLDVSSKFCHPSSTAEQHFCKVKVHGSNPWGGFGKILKPSG